MLRSNIHFARLSSPLAASRRTLLPVLLAGLMTVSMTKAEEEIGFTIWGNYNLGAGATLSLESGIVQVAGNFNIAINNPARFDLVNATLQFIGLPAAGPYLVEALSEDIGFCDLTLPDPNLFSMKRLLVGPSTIKVAMVDNHDNSPGIGNEALYVETLQFEPGTQLDVRGINIYYITVIPADAGEPGSGVTILDTVGEGGIWALGTDSPVTPTDPGTTDNEICFGDSTQLFATANPGLEIDWYTDDCGISPSNRPLGTFVGTGTPLMVSPTVTTVYRAQSRNPATGCISRICSDSVEVIVHDNPLCNVTASSIVCTGGSNLSATVENAGSNTTYDWTVTGGTISSGQNTDTIEFVADDVPSILIEVTVTKTWDEGDGSVCVSSCDTTIITDRYNWTGADGASFSDSGNWDPATVPGTYDPGGDAIITNSGSTDNRCILDDVGGSYLMCNAKIRGTGSGRQILQINEGSVLATTVSTLIETGGEIVLRGGEITGGTVYNNSNTLAGYGLISADVVNAGLLEARPSVEVTLLLTGASFENQPAGLLRGRIGSLTTVQSNSVTQQGGIEIQGNGSIVFEGPLTNGTGGTISLYGGVLGTDGLTNDAGAFIFGTGIIQSSLNNQGYVTTIADTLLVGDVENDGTITIQNGLLTVTGMVSGSGTIIGGFGGRDGEPAACTVDGDLRLGAAASLILEDACLTLAGDFDVAVDETSRLQLSGATIDLAGGLHEAQGLEVLAADTGGASLPSDDLAVVVGELRIGPGPAGVRLVDQHRNSIDRGRRAAGSTRETMYVRQLTLEPGATLDLAGRTLYYAEAAPSNWQAQRHGVRIIDSIGGGGLHHIGERRRTDD